MSELPRKSPPNVMDYDDGTIECAECGGDMGIPHGGIKLMAENAEYDHKKGAFTVVLIWLQVTCPVCSGVYRMRTKRLQRPEWENKDAAEIDRMIRDKEI